ncbi:cyanamide hydratase [Curtobacterium sp. MCPF17_047]|uniref:HD domain-containing protein n=1 Tax=unclassified Curtobacterium TaxID=257496 RepID=UPI000DA8ED9E|nr:MULTISPECIES: HD domain-containing protein [unclassified Curtobacterium]PZE57973.1 cyanamide hydratase [Curtobacterium sp. MCPF17_001]PZF65842.1 cyanamide hydratase [Curtobacterium sp. MCPF17_047]
MALDLDALLAPPTPTAARALDVVRAWSSPALVHHCLRSWAWATLLAPTIELAPDPELLFVATMLHDLGVTPHFDAAQVPFEVAGGAVGSVFAIGAGWPAARARRVGEIVERHMWPSVDPDLDAEGHLLEVATSLDVSGVGMERWDHDDLRIVTAALPRLGFSDDFHGLVHDQAGRKPESAAARLDHSGNVLAGGQRWASLLAG